MNTHQNNTQLIDELRKELGMPSYQEALEENRNSVKMEGGKMPGTYEEYKVAATTWRKSVGWE